MHKWVSTEILKISLTNKKLPIYFYKFELVTNFYYILLEQTKSRLTSP